MSLSIEHSVQPWHINAGLQGHTPSTSSARVQALQRLRGLILLGGAVRQPTLSVANGRSILDLPVTNDQTLMQYWQDEASNLRKWLGCERLRLRVLLARDSVKPRRPSREPGISVRIERDLVEYRGIGGVLRDLSNDYDEDDYLLVASAAQLLLMPLSELVCELAGSNGHMPDVSLVSHHDGTPSGMMLIRCGALKCIPEVGFVDMKEQALSIIADHHHVQVINPTLLSAIPVRTRSDYISALRWRNRCETGSPAQVGAVLPFAEDWEPTFRIVESGAVVENGSQVHDSVILRGAVVERGAIVVRSVVGPGCTIRAGVVCSEKLASGNSG